MISIPVFLAVIGVIALGMWVVVLLMLAMKWAVYWILNRIVWRYLID